MSQVYKPTAVCPEHGRQKVVDFKVAYSDSQVTKFDYIELNCGCVL